MLHIHSYAARTVDEVRYLPTYLGVVERKILLQYFIATQAEFALSVRWVPEFRIRHHRRALEKFAFRSQFRRTRGRSCCWLNASGLLAGHSKKNKPRARREQEVFDTVFKKNHRRKTVGPHVTIVWFPDQTPQTHHFLGCVLVIPNSHLHLP